MSWVLPRTWNAGEVVSAAQLNIHIRDNSNLLATNVQVTAAGGSSFGWLCPGIKNYGYSSGQGNGAGSVDTQLTSFDTTIPANSMTKPGDAVIIEGMWVTSATAGTRTGKIQLGSGTLVTIIVTTQASINIPFRIVLRRRTSTVGSITGIHVLSLSALYLNNAGLSSLDFTTSQTLKFFANAATSGMLTLCDLRVTWGLVLAGATV